MKAVTLQLSLKDVRLSYPNVFELNADNGYAPRFRASFLFAASHPAKKQIEAGMEKVAREAWGEKARLVLAGLRTDNRICLGDGNQKTYDGYKDHWYLRASSQQRPFVFDRDRSNLTIADGKPYAGCYVNASVELWVQDTRNFGKRINATLRGVQFVRDGDPFVGGTPLDPDEFENLDARGIPADVEALL